MPNRLSFLSSAPKRSHVPPPRCGSLPIRSDSHERSSIYRHVFAERSGGISNIEVLTLDFDSNRSFPR